MGTFTRRLTNRRGPLKSAPRTVQPSPPRLRNERKGSRRAQDTPGLADSSRPCAAHEHVTTGTRDRRPGTHAQYRLPLLVHATPACLNSAMAAVTSA